MTEGRPLCIDLRNECGPFDIIGDVHGCFRELVQLLGDMGYVLEQLCNGNEIAFRVIPPAGRKAVFLGDLVDRGPDPVNVLKLVMGMVKAGNAWCVCGNHDMRVLKKLQTGNVKTSHGGPDWSVIELTTHGDAFCAEVRSFMEGLVSHYVLDGGKLVVAHAGIKEALQGRESAEVREFAIYGENTGEIDEYGLPVRYEWAADYGGKALVVYGHTPQERVQTVNNAINIDTGCVFGGMLTAYHYPEGKFSHVQAAKIYCPPAKPFLEKHQYCARGRPRALWDS